MTAVPTILVLGATGMLGTALVPRLAPQARVVTHGRHAAADERVDLCDATATQRMLAAVRPDLIVNLAALTNVDTCERNPAQAFTQNVASVQHVVEWMQGARTACHLVHLSTDHVYDGPGAHDESTACPANYYAFSKYAGELVASRAGATVVRTNFFGRSRCPGRASLTDWLHAALQQRETITVFEDVLFSPLSLTTLCGILVELTQRRPAGVYNAGSRQGMSKADFAFAFAAQAGVQTATMQRGSVAAASALAAYRPRDMRMDNHKLEQLLGIRMPTLSAEITLAAKDYHHAE